jgi:predicted metalloprotease
MGSLEEQGQWQVQHGCKWWDVPGATNDAIEAARAVGCDEVVYTYDWGDTYSGSYGHGISRYRLDFKKLVHTNIDSGSQRKVRFIKILAR